MKDNQFSEYDKNVKVRPDRQEIRDAMIEGSGWVRSDGDFPGHFRKRGANSCIFSFKWATGTWGVLLPDMWFNLEEMTSVELLAEARDILLRWPTHIRVSKELSPLMTEYATGQLKRPDYFLDQLKKAITRVRGNYADGICLWDPPSALLIMYKKYRPGAWGPVHVPPSMTDTGKTTWSTRRGH